MKNPIVNYIARNYILSTVIVVAIAFFLFEIKGILIAIFASYIIMASLYPFVRFLRNKKIPKIIAVISIYALIIGVIILLVVPIWPLLVSQVISFLDAAPTYINKASSSLGIQISKDQIDSAILSTASSVGQRAISATTQVFGGVFSILTVFILSFYLLLDRDRYETTIPNLFPSKYKKRARDAMHQVEEKLGFWLRGQIVLSFSVGILTWVALTILGLEFALPLAILAGALEIIPTLGPIIAAVPAVIVGLSISPLITMWIIVAYTVIQVMENNILVPKIMEKAVGLNPVFIIVVILIGANLSGVIGALLSIPFVSALIIILKALNKIK